MGFLKLTGNTCHIFNLPKYSECLESTRDVGLRCEFVSGSHNVNRDPLSRSGARQLICSGRPRGHPRIMVMRQITRWRPRPGWFRLRRKERTSGRSRLPLGHESWRSTDLFGGLSFLDKLSYWELGVIQTEIATNAEYITNRA